MTFLDQFLWVIYPYIVISIFILGLIMRYNTDQKRWTAKSSQLLEKRLLKWGSLLFHVGIIFVFFGHVAGIIVPLAFYELFGVPDVQYRLMASVMGGLSGIAATVGLLILLYRRFLIKRIRLSSSISDLISIVLLVIVVLNGMVVTAAHSLDTSGFDYRANLAPWFRSIFSFSPNTLLMTMVPSIFKFHVFSAFTFFALMPFTRMVHILSLPITFLGRSYIVYRKRH
jgi:nitrate reductase gamma subunit